MKKGELQSRINRKNEEINLLKVGLSGIVNRYGFQTVHDFYKVFAISKTANTDYRNKSDKWENRYGEKHKGGKKAYTDGYRIIKGKIQTGKRNRPQKA